MIAVIFHPNIGNKPIATNIETNTTRKGIHTPRNCLKQKYKKINMNNKPKGSNRTKSFIMFEAMLDLVYGGPPKYTFSGPEDSEIIF